jgi:hypothetical protein
MGRIRPMAFSPWPRSFGRGGLQSGVHQPAGTARPTREAGPRGARPIARVTHSASWSPHSGHARRGLRGKHHGEEGQPPDKEARRVLTQNSGAPVEQWGGTTQWRSTMVEGLSVAGNDVTKVGAAGIEREESEAPLTMNQERKGPAGGEAHRRGRGRRCLSAILLRGEWLGGSRAVAGIGGDEEGGGASGMDKRGTGQKRGMGGGRRHLWRLGGAAERKGVGGGWRVAATRRGEAREGGSRHGRWQPGGSGNGSHAGEAGEEREKGRWLSGGTDPTVGPSGRERRRTGHCGWPTQRWDPPLAVRREV